EQILCLGTPGGWRGTEKATKVRQPTCLAQRILQIALAWRGRGCHAHVPNHMHTPTHTGTHPHSDTQAGMHPRIHVHTPTCMLHSVALGVVLGQAGRAVAPPCPQGPSCSGPWARQPSCKGRGVTVDHTEVGKGQGRRAAWPVPRWHLSFPVGQTGWGWQGRILECYPHAFYWSDSPQAQ
uniref:Uncharacterized protein n=1 Tax=Scleropages formosus TaxID=113540 RepID=A0A8C9W929_SCLFO